MKFHGVLADKLYRLAADIAVPTILRRKRVLSAVALTKAAIASAKVGGTGGGLGVVSLPWEVPAPSCPRVLDDI
jgi:hypothetical protein